MSYLSGKTIEKIIVPVRCGTKQGTAFFISATQLLTARHVVNAHFRSTASPEQIYIDVQGKKILCKGEELSIDDDNRVDLALLTIENREEFRADEYLTLLCDNYTHGLELRVFGYPQEIAMGCNLVCMEVRNSLERESHPKSDRILKREDMLNLRNYNGLSGSPVVCASGRVIGVIVLQMNETLSYLSVAKAKEYYDNKGIKYDSDGEKDDTTTVGMGRSLRFCEIAVATMHDRYMPKLHQPDNSLESVLDYFSDIREYEVSKEKAVTLAECVVGLPQRMQKMIQQRLETNKILTKEDLMDNGGVMLNKCRKYLSLHPFQSMGDWELVSKLNDSAYQLNDEDFDRLMYHTKQCLCITGKAGSGKTHSLCHYSLSKQGIVNIYLFFGTNFQYSMSAIDHVREKVCEGMSFEDFNDELVRRNRYAVIVIDAINEGLGSSYWNNNLGALREELNDYSNIRLVISIRKPFDIELTDLSRQTDWFFYTIDGFANKEQAIEGYFEEYGVDMKYKNQRVEAFKNPLFLKIFCESYQTLTEEERRHISKQVLYKRYVFKKNVAVSDKADEDPSLNIADKYLATLANYSVFYGHFNPITKSKARQYARRIAPFRVWSNDLLHACISTNLLLDDFSHMGEPAVMYEYESLGDYYKAEALQHSKMDVQGLLHWIEEQQHYFARNPNVPSEKFANAVKALFDCWYQQTEDIYQYKALHKGGSLYELYYEYLLDSEIPVDALVNVLLKLDDDKVNPLQILQNLDDVSCEDALYIHDRLKNDFPNVSSRDLIWTRYVNQMYERYGDMYVNNAPCEENVDSDITDVDRVYLIAVTWMFSSSHPRFRAILIRKIRKILALHNDLIQWLIELFEDVNDPYVVGGLYCAVCGVVLSSRDSEMVTRIAKHIYEHYYEGERAVPQDLIVRQWTLKIIERASYLDKQCVYWSQIKTPFKPLPVDTALIPKRSSIYADYFGMQRGSKAIYYSIFTSEDFNRYIIGRNSRNNSNDYFQRNEDETYIGVSLDEVMAEMSYYITQVFRWNDKLGSVDNGKFSPDRHHNDQERLGKKYQWLAWFRVNARMMDAYRTSKNQHHYSDKANEGDLATTPYPWYSGSVLRFDPTIDISLKMEHSAGLNDVEEQPMAGFDQADWIENNAYLPVFRWKAQREGEEYVMLVGYDKSDQTDKQIYLSSKACFVRKEEASAFVEWARNQNFHGIWMPDRSGYTEFLWNDYPWADAYKSQIDHDDYSECPCQLYISYEAQLQEDWEGIASDDEYLSTVYMPCVEMMNQLGLYCSEIRGIVKAEDGSVAAINTGNERNGICGMYIRRDILNDFINRNGYVMFYYVSGQKILTKDNKYYSKDISAAYQYNPNDDVTGIQPLRVVDAILPDESGVDKAARYEELLRKNHEKGLTTREQNELAKLMKLAKGSDFMEALKTTSDDEEFEE